MRRLLLLLLAITFGILAAMLVYQQIARRPGGPEDPRLSEPPAVLTKEQLGDRRRLFDQETLNGWTVEGPAAVQDNNVVLGGDSAAKAFLIHKLKDGETLEFHFFQEGEEKAELLIQPVLHNPQDPQANYRRDFAMGLKLSGYVYKRWHVVRLTAQDQAQHWGLDHDIKPLGDGMGLSSSGHYGFPARDGCDCRIGFAVGPGSKLFLRNVVLREAPAAPQP